MEHIRTAKKVENLFLHKNKIYVKIGGDESG